MEKVTIKNFNPTRLIRLTETGLRVHQNNGFDSCDRILIVDEKHANSHPHQGWVRIYKVGGQHTDDNTPFGAYIGNKEDSYLYYDSDDNYDIKSIIKNLDKIEQKIKDGNI